MTNLTSRGRTLRRVLLSSLLGLCCLCTMPGCAQFVLLSYIIGGPPSIEPDFDAETGDSLVGKEKRIAVVCYAPTDLIYEYPKIDAEVASALSYRLSDAVSITVGGNNVFDEYPDEWDPVRAFPFPQLGFTYGWETVPFGINGGYYFARIGYRLKHGT